jgi:hypothetical protein
MTLTIQALRADGWIAAAFAGLAWFAIEHNLIRFSLAY